jgi:hypothetical protein
VSPEDIVALVTSPIAASRFVDFAYDVLFRRWGKHGRRLADACSWKVTDLAAIIAGRKRPGVREEWHAHLVGEVGHELPIWQKVAAALGFMAAAVRYRLQDAAEVAWIPADAVLRSRPLSNLVAGTPTVTAAAILFRHAGTVGVLASAESIAAIGGSLYAMIRVGRWWRGVKPQEPKAAASKSDGNIKDAGRG